ncbi:MAG: iron permease [Enterovirga sp.]|jgi:high-affinity iron transporter|nr:iron permease [Enterovirga sp.]
MIGAAIIVFREAIEAGLIIGIVLAATRGIAGRGRWIGLGLAGGALGAGLVAAFASIISDAFEGTGQELLNAGVLASAVLMLAWHNAWMASHGRELAAELRAVGHSVRVGQRPLAALAIVVGAATLREGAEVVLFLYGIVAAGTSMASLLAGGALGLLAGAALSLLSYVGLSAIPARYVFSVTTSLITLLAAGLAAQAAQFASAAGLITVLDRIVWNTSKILPEDGTLGRILHTLIGYTANPTQLQLLVYAGTIAGMLVLMRVAGAKSRAFRPSAVPAV